jgi:hypothetical protein
LLVLLASPQKPPGMPVWRVGFLKRTTASRLAHGTQNSAVATLQVYFVSPWL